MRDFTERCCWLSYSNSIIVTVIPQESMFDMGKTLLMMIIVI